MEAIMLATLKKCSKCGEEKPPCEFSSNNAFCKKCGRAYTKDRQAIYKKANLEGKPVIARTDKKCPKCKEIKPLSDFWVDVSTPDGHVAYCISCKTPGGTEKMKPFKRTTLKGEDGRLLPKKTIVCSACGVEDSVASTFTEESAKASFTHKGWSVAKKRHDDLCSDCAAKRCKKHKADDSVQAQTGILEEDMSHVDVQPLVHADEPRKATIAQKRLISEKLDDVYPVPDKGYINGYTDEKLAKELNMPRAWVTERRVDMYGERETPAVDFSLHSKTLSDLRSDLNALNRRNLDSERAIEAQRGIIARQSQEIQILSAKLEALEGDIKTAIDLAL
jgi:hypothetical protein